MIDETHDPALRSWVESANNENSEFPIQNLPLAAYLHGREQRPRIGVAIGNAIFDTSQWLPHENLNGYFALTAAERRDLRREWSRALREGAPQGDLVPQTECQMLLPAIVPDYTDFYASIHHATNVGKMFRPDNPLLPNYKHVPVAYHGRASSIVVSGTPIKRPAGQLGENIFGLSQELDYEVELGAFVGPGNAMGRPISIDEARDHVAGFCLLNDWSARDIQRWEYQPLGPFLAKNFATSISPWVITLDALEPFRVPAPPHDTPTLPYLLSSGADAFDITLEVWLRTRSMNEPVRLSRTAFREMYWTFTQMLAHHASNGCPLRPGDLIGSGTVSGPSRENRGCLLELTWRSKDPVLLPTGEERCFLENGDEVILHGYSARQGFRRIGFGVCRGTIVR